MIVRKLKWIYSRIDNCIIGRNLNNFDAVLKCDYLIFDGCRIFLYKMFYESIIRLNRGIILTPNFNEKKYYDFSVEKGYLI